MKIILVRHGESLFNQMNRDANHGRVFSGQYDIPLTEKGREQAETLQMENNFAEADCVYSSDLSRAYETAQITTLRTDIIRDARLNERSLSVFNGKSENQLSEYRTFLETQNFGHSFSDKAPDGESYTDVNKRIKSFLLELDYSSNTVLIFSHFVAIRLIIKELMSSTEEQTLELSIKNCTPLIFEGKELGEFVEFR